MAAERREGRGAAGGRGFVSLGAPKRTKAAFKLSVPRPVNLPSLKKENAGTEPSGTGGAGGGAGWAGSREPESSAHAGHASEPGPGPSLVEKAGWAHGRPAAAPSAWEQPRALSLREFPSLAAAASVPQQQQQQQQQHPLPQPDQHGAWDEDERGRGLPTGPGRPSRPAFRGRSQDARFDPAFGGGDDGEFHGPPPPHAAGPHYGRHHGEFSPSPQHRRFEEEPPYGRYGRPPPPGPGPYWRDEPPPRDWHRHDRFDGPPQRYGPPRRDFGGRYGRGGPSIDEEPEHPHDRHGRYPDQGRFERFGPHGGDPRDRDPALFPPPPPGQPRSRQAPSPPPEREREPSQQRRGCEDEGRAAAEPARHPPAASRSPLPRPEPDRLSSAGAAEVQPVQPPPPPPPKQQPAAEQPANAAEEPAAPEANSAAEPSPAASAPAHQQQAAAQQQRKGAGGERKNERRAAALHAGKAAGGKREAAQQQAPPPPPPPAAPKPPPPAAPPLKTSVVKPGVSWKAMLAGVSDESAAPAQPASASDAGDKAGKRERGRGKKEGKKEAGGAAAPAPAAAGAAGEAAGAGKQRGKQRTRGGKKGGAAAEEGAQPEAAQQVAGDAGKAAGRARGRGRGKDAAEHPTAADAEAAEAETTAAPEPAEATAPAEPAYEPLPVAAPAVDASAAAAAAAAIDAAPVLAPALAVQLAQPLAAAPLAAALAAPAAAPAGAAAGAGVSAPLMGAAFGWSSPLADEVAKLQLSTAGAHDGPAGIVPLGPTTTEHQLASSLALLPTLGRDLREPSPPMQPAAAAAAPADPSSGSVADVITSLPADLSLDLAAAPPAAPAAAPAVGAGQPFSSASPPPPSASPPPFPGGLFPATTASWAQPPSKEAVQLFEGAAAGQSFAFGSITSTHMQFGPVAAAFGQQQPQFGAGGGVDWSSPAPSPPPYMAPPHLGPAAAFGPPGVSQYGPPPGLGGAPQQQQHHHHMYQAGPMMPGGPHAGPYGMPHPGMPPSQHQQHQQHLQQQHQQHQQVLRQMPAVLEDPAAALPDDVFDAPPQQAHAASHQGQPNGQARGRNYGGRGRQRGPRYAQQQQQQVQQQHPHAQAGNYGAQPGGYPPSAIGFPQQMPSWASQAPHFLPPQLVGPRQQQGNSGRGRGRGRNGTANGAANGGGNRGGNRGQPKQHQQWAERRVLSNGAGWVSGYIAGRCPGSDPKKLLALQRVNFPALNKQCQPGSSCTACMCQLSNAMAVAKGDPADLSLCLNNFRTIMTFPAALGGSGLSKAAYSRLSLCPVADPPCADQKAGAVFGTLGPALMPTSAGADLACLSGKQERECAAACMSTAGCGGFSFNALVTPTRCCLKSSPGWEGQSLSRTGEQMYYHLPAGTTTEDDMFAQRTPWGGGAIAPAAATPTPTTSAAPSTASAASPVSGVPSAPTASDAPCAQTACDDRQPPGGWTCKQQARSTRGKDWGKCGEPWMAGFCLQTCNKCPCGAASPPVSAAPATAPSATPSPSPSPAAPAAAACTCTDVMPSRHSCADEAKWGSCGKRYMKPTTDVPEGFCQISCGRCTCPQVQQCECTDLQPSYGTTCQEHRAWGACGQEWMWMAFGSRPRGYCQTTCARCTC
ncbi:hypothetical protein C2E20_5236 [Micractinium conductrix]|uniref:Uncharacterized protein n=1 Tax=Micractinium conductrix TaxID=554055 RepID=A0A2P6VBH1_9CHLO|nr:hypothetical protein C2E20_5236 [Micractinium conductrix]|eukprot:PSC71429.1 hypothetical protein C2E20_5236 [Micractinium conductrix]